MFCEKCGAKLDEHQKFCAVCGTAVLNDINAVEIATENVTDENATSVKKSKIKKNLIIYCIIVGALLLVAIGMIIGTVLLESRLSSDATDDSSENKKTSRQQTTELVVPNFVGLVYDEIKDDERYSDFNIVIEYEYSNEVAYGKIISQSQKEGITVKNTEEIILVISRGPETVEIPKVEGLNVQDAKMQLTRVGLQYNEIPQPHATVPINCVIMTNPTDGSVPKGETIDIYVSTGPAIDWITVGSYLRYKEEIARQLVERDGFKVEVVYKDSADDKGVVIAQSHAAGTSIEKGTTIVLTVSTGITPQ